MVNRVAGLKKDIEHLLGWHSNKRRGSSQFGGAQGNLTLAEERCVRKEDKAKRGEAVDVPRILSYGESSPLA